jgi:DNA ligase-1
MSDRREFLMLAHDFNPKKHGPGGWFLSEKMDGMRCYWDGGFTRGLLKSEVPFANHTKDERYLQEPVCTGLWSRYGNVIHAPDWWLNALPKMPLDGELWNPNLTRQKLMSIIKKLNPTPASWEPITLHCFDIPPFSAVFQLGRISSNFFEKRITQDIVDWAVSWMEKQDWEYLPAPNLRVETAYYVLGRMLPARDPMVAVPVHQTLLSFQTSQALEIIEQELDRIADAGGEGLMVRNPSSFWRPIRAKTLLKIKKLQDAEGTVVGYTTGRETDKGSKLRGLMGALIVEWEGKTFELSGFTEAERVLTFINHYTVKNDLYAHKWAWKHPDATCPNFIQAKAFPPGTLVTFRYRGLTDDGIPQEARYWRKRTCVE